jgi:hypothetical protein
MNDTELIEFYNWLSERAIIDDSCRGIGEAECAVKLYNKSKVENLDIQNVTNCPLCGGETTFLESDKCLTADCPNRIF